MSNRSVTIADLRSFATSNKIALGGARSKSDIVDKIKSPASDSSSSSSSSDDDDDDNKRTPAPKKAASQPKTPAAKKTPAVAAVYTPPQVSEAQLNSLPPHSFDAKAEPTPALSVVQLKEWAKVNKVDLTETLFEARDLPPLPRCLGKQELEVKKKRMKQSKNKMSILFVSRIC